MTSQDFKNALYKGGGLARKLLTVNSDFHQLAMDGLKKAWAEKM
jgi:hypothetical protein